jgi:hypothetical protein
VPPHLFERLLAKEVEASWGKTNAIRHAVAYSYAEL